MNWSCSKNLVNEKPRRQQGEKENDGPKNENERLDRPICNRLADPNDQLHKNYRTLLSPGFSFELKLLSSTIVNQDDPNNFRKENFTHGTVPFATDRSIQLSILFSKQNV